jgi:phospholipid/cholesterol/gamma-HCH transport system permease protein
MRPERTGESIPTRMSAKETRAHKPTLQQAVDGTRRDLVLAGSWTMTHGVLLQDLLQSVKAPHTAQTTINLAGLTSLDTLGALQIGRLRQAAQTAGSKVTIVGATNEQEILLSEVVLQPATQIRAANHGYVDILEDVGKGVVDFGRDMMTGVGFLGQFIAVLGRLIRHPSKFRTAAFVRQMEAVGLRSVPIITLISFLVGCIVAQQSVFQLRTFGTTAFVADLLGILVLRELGLLLAAIMVAGRSGSAMTAEIGSMKMREEIDALRTMGLDPMEVLVVPRILALIVCLPILTFLSSMAGLLGGGLIAWVYGDVSPDVFLGRLQIAIQFNTFMVGMIKAPVMALVIGLIATMEGLAVQGSAESLGRQTTASVVKAIFMVIVVDGLFAMFFAAIRY